MALALIHWGNVYILPFWKATGHYLVPKHMCHEMLNVDLINISFWVHLSFISILFGFFKKLQNLILTTPFMFIKGLYKKEMMGTNNNQKARRMVPQLLTHKYNKISFICDTTRDYLYYQPFRDKPYTHKGEIFKEAIWSRKSDHVCFQTKKNFFKLNVHLKNKMGRLVAQ